MSKHTFLSLPLSFVLLLWSSPVVALDSTDILPLNGQGNNIDHPQWGASLTSFLRLDTASYEDGIVAPAGSTRPSARALTNALHAQGNSVPSRRMLTDMVWQWGQFVTHDMALTKNHAPAENMFIAVPLGDATFDLLSTGTKTISFRRSDYDPLTGSGAGNPRQQRNEVTSFIDASQVYGSDLTRSAALRTFSGGLMKTSSGNLLPFNTAGLENELVGAAPNFFLAGDIRANEQLGLTSLHTLFLREHNRLAKQLKASNPSLTDEQLYQRARRLVAAEMQAITYNEFLPALLGYNALRPYRGYQATVHPEVDNTFATATFRIGHSMTSNQLLRLNENGSAISQGNLTLRQASLQPQKLVEEGGIDPLLRGLSTQVMEEMDMRVVDGLRNILFGAPGGPGTDVMAADIQRGRDHGIPDYNTLRAQYGLKKAVTFADITSDTSVSTALVQAYGSVGNIDAIVGMFAENHVPGTSVGPLARAMLIDQFRRLRDGDRFWYESALSSKDRRDITNTRLSDVIRRNTSIQRLQQNVFITSPGKVKQTMPSFFP